MEEYHGRLLKNRFKSPSPLKQDFEKRFQDRFRNIQADTPQVKSYPRKRVLQPK